ncbi:hypothetical protein [Streptomyces ossamyceticus]|uniref:hypothetical protein n=1 Tax=Streptomyces ossamyceticus TaxID=249581 RepID=UPI003421B22B
MSERRENPLARARRELEAFEAAVFQFGQRTRAFLDAFPADLPEPLSVLPKFASEYGPTEYGARSYLHLVFAGPDGVKAWAERLGVPVARSCDDADGMAFVRAQGVLDGISLFVGCMTPATDEELTQARLKDAAEGGTR